MKFCADMAGLKTKENTFCGILLVSFLGMRENLGKLLDVLSQL